MVQVGAWQSAELAPEEASICALIHSLLSQASLISMAELRVAYLIRALTQVEVRPQHASICGICPADQATGAAEKICCMCRFSLPIQEEEQHSPSGQCSFCLGDYMN